MATTSAHEIADLQAAGRLKDHALDALRSDGLATDAQVQAVVDYYQPLVERLEESDDREVVRGVADELEAAVERVDRARTSLIHRSRDTRDERALDRIRNLQATLERSLRKLRALYRGLTDEAWTFFLTQRNPAMPSVRPKPRRARDKPTREKWSKATREASTKALPKAPPKVPMESTPEAESEKT